MSLERSGEPRRLLTWGAVSLAALTIIALVLALTPLRLPVEPAAVKAGGGVRVTLLAWYDFPRDDPRSAELSGITWEDGSRTLYAISDDTGRITPLRPSDDFRTWSFGVSIMVDIPEQWDGEGIALREDGFTVSNEFGPRIFEVDRGGRTVAEVPVPPHYGRILRNRGFEALSLSPDRRYLFTANESPLEGDGPQPTVSAGGVVRILRHDRVTHAQTEYAYRTDPVFAPGEGGDRGVVELVALSDTELLVMERSFVAGTGNNVRIYQVNLSGAADVIAVPNLGEQTPSLTRTLLVDLADLPDEGFPEPRQPQPNRILDNFEGMALGPHLPGGRRILFVISDDNKRDTQTPRLLVLAVAGL